MDQVEGADADHVACAGLAGRVGNFRVKANDLAGLRHFLQQHQLQAAQVLQAGQLLCIGHFADQIQAVRILRRHQRRQNLAVGFTGHVAHDAEQLAEVADPDLQPFLQVRKFGFVLLVAPVQRVAAALFRGQLARNFLQHALTLVARLAKAFHPLAVEAGTLPGLQADQFEKFKYGVGLFQRDGRLRLFLGCDGSGQDDRQSR